MSSPSTFNFDFDFIYRINILERVASTGVNRIVDEIEFSITKPLEPGDTFSLNVTKVNGDQVSVDVTYEGTNDEGDVFLSGNLRPISRLYPNNEKSFFLSDTKHHRGDCAPDNDGGNFICFAAGTPILTVTGEKPVEELRPGDLLVGAFGKTARVKWIGYQTGSKALTPSARLCPVRIKAGALGYNVPHTDLVVTGDHGILIKGVMVNAAALVNGTTIVRTPKDELPDIVTYYHIETDDHDVIFAAGTPAETFVDATARTRFRNYDEYVALFGESVGPMPVLPYPRVFGPRQVPENVRALVEARAACDEETAVAA